MPGADVGVLDRVIALGWKDRVGLETEPDLEAARRDPRFQERLDRLPKLVAERGDR
jgi:hypothetical protein